MRIGEYIKYKRQSLGLSQAQLAERLKISKQAVSKWEKGAAVPDVMTIPDIAGVLNVEPEFLMRIIWIGETGEHVNYFVSVNIEKKRRPSYLLRIYEIDDFSGAKELYEKICSGQNEAVLQTLIDYYNCDPHINFFVELWEAVYYADDEAPSKSLVIDSMKLNSLIKSHAQEI